VQVREGEFGRDPVTVRESRRDCPIVIRVADRLVVACEREEVDEPHGDRPEREERHGPLRYAIVVHVVS
jgi:hypothetical protein